jgi:hypothetical protein
METLPLRWPQDSPSSHCKVRKSSDLAHKLAGKFERLLGSIGGTLLTGRSDQPVGLHQGARILGLGSERKADRDKDCAQQQAYDHHTPVGPPVGLVERRGHGYP